jgi:hypothetical protein
MEPLLTPSAAHWSSSMTDLSPAAQAAIRAYSKIAYDDDVDVIFKPLPWEQKAIAAAFRITADYLDDATSARTLYAIANELENR